ncbi:MAG TPA: SDR family NAD(P)-dependent oxidoreductase [Candidatus Paceibacterota bacterium]
MAYPFKKILVTGSSGTIGTRLSETLLKEGFDIVGVDKEPNTWNEEVQRKTIILDLRDKERVLRELPKDVDAVVHLAANARVYNLVIDPSLARDNFETVFNVLEFARQNSIKRFMFSSSREVYGNSEKIIHAEDDVHIDYCESPYTASKIGGEALVQSYRQCYGMETIIFRFSNVYGMYDQSDRVIPLFIKLCTEGKDLVVYGKEKLLDYTYIDDCVSGVIAALKEFPSINGQVYNIAYGKGTSIVDVAQLIQKRMQSKGEVRIEENRTGEVVRYIADVSKAKQSFGYEPKVPIEEGVNKTVDWYLKHLYTT